MLCAWLKAPNGVRESFLHKGHLEVLGAWAIHKKKADPKADLFSVIQWGFRASR